MGLNKYTELNPGSGGSIMDESGIIYSVPGEPTDRRRARIIITGENLSDITQIKNTQISGSEYGIVTRNIPFCPSNSQVVFDTVSAVAANNQTVVATYTVPASSTFFFKGFAGTGDVPAIYRVYIDGTPIMALRTTSTSPNASLVYDAPILQVASGIIVTLEVVHYSTGINGDFEGTIVGFTV